MRQGAIEPQWKDQGAIAPDIPGKHVVSYASGFQLVLIGWHDLTVDPRRISGRHLKYALFQPILSMPICVIGRPTRFLDQGIVSHDLPGNSVGRSRLWIRVLSHIPQRHPRAKQSPLHCGHSCRSDVGGSCRLYFPNADHNPPPSHSLRPGDRRNVQCVSVDCAVAAI